MPSRAVSIVASLAIAALAAGCGSASQRAGQQTKGPPHVLTMAQAFDNLEELQDFAAEVRRLSKDKLRIRFVGARYRERPDFERLTIRDVRQGRSDLGFVGVRTWDVLGARRMSAVMAPLLVDSYALEERVLAGKLGRAMLAELRPLGLVGIGMLPGPIRHPFGVSERLAGPADYRGLTIGTQDSRVADATMRALGARPVHTPADTVGYKGVDGLEQRAYVLYGDRLAVPGSHITANVNLWPRPLVIFANAKAYKQLSGDERQVLQQAAANAAPKSAPRASRDEVEAAGNLCRVGRVAFDVATRAELRSLQEAVAPVYDELEADPETRETIAQIGALKAQLAEPPTVLPRCAGTTTTQVAAPTKLDGVWRMDTDVRAAGTGGLDENWGHWIFVFDHGKFADTQENETSCTWGYGTFTVHGDETSWKFTDGGGISPNNATNKPGEFFVFRLSSYRDTLTLKPVQGEISPLNFRDKTWRRVSTSPTRHFFSKRCPPPASALPG